MPQVFRRSSNSLSKISIVVVALLVGSVLGGLYFLERSSYVTGVGIVSEQPVPFSHEHHYSGLGIDCRYCHYNVERSPHAGVPPTQTCMNCHSQIWTNAALLQPVRDSFKSGEPIEWNRVHDLPDYVYFNHSIHVGKGVGCSSCHGQVNKMPLMYQAKALTMEWCLECHRNPEKFVRPKEEVVNMDWHPAKDQHIRGAQLVKDYHIAKKTNCSVCHR